MSTQQDPESEATPADIGSYQDNRPTSVLPGSNGTVSGTAITDWLDDEGKPIYGKSGDA